MVAVKRLRSRGATITVQANGEVLFAPGADLWLWKNRLTAKVQRATALHAPINKRPRWAHYGKPLKRTIIADTRTRITRGGGFFYMVVGSTSNHAYYVDQGTGIFAGNSPYEAKVLPPTSQGGSNLYERSWVPGGARGAKPGYSRVMIKGQPGQFFFDAGLRDGYRAMRLRSLKLPGEGTSAMSSALRSMPTGLENFLGNTPADAGFRASLREWRVWRDAAYNDGRDLRNPGRRRSVGDGTRKSRSVKPRTRRTPAEDERRKYESRLRSQRYRDAQSERKRRASAQARKASRVGFEERKRTERTRFLSVIRKRGVVVAGSLQFEKGRWVAKVLVKGRGGVSRPEDFQGRKIT